MEDIKIPWIQFEDCLPPVNSTILVYNPILIKHSFLTGYQSWFWDIASEELLKEGLLSFTHWVPLNEPKIETYQKAA